MASPAGQSYSWRSYDLLRAIRLGPCAPTCPTDVARLLDHNSLGEMGAHQTKWAIILQQHFKMTWPWLMVAGDMCAPAQLPTGLISRFRAGCMLRSLLLILICNPQSWKKVAYTGKFSYSCCRCHVSYAYLMSQSWETQGIIVHLLTRSQP